MVKDAEAHAEEDKQRREEAEVRNNADSLVYQTEKVLQDQGDTVQPTRRTRRSPLADLKTALEGNDTRPSRRHRGAHGASQAFSQKLYEAAAKDAVAPRVRRHRARVMVRSTTTTSSMPRSSTIRPTETPRQVLEHVRYGETVIFTIPTT